MSQIIEITDFTAPELDAYARLTERELYSCFHPKEGLFIAESPNVILRALDAGFVPVSLLMEHKHVEGQAAEVIARCGDIPVYTAEPEILTKLTGFQLTRGVLCAMYRPPKQTVEEVCKGARRIAVLENVVNPTNVGAIFRSAAALDIDAVLLTRTSCDPFCRRAVRVSMGSVFLVPWTWLDDAPLQPQIAALGFRSVAMALVDRSVSIDDAALLAEPRLAIVMGTEGDGLATTVIDDADYVARIPMSHGVDSLNVAAAAAVAFWQLRVRE